MEISDLVVRIIILIFPGLLSISLINSLIKKERLIIGNILFMLP